MAMFPIPLMPFLPFSQAGSQRHSPQPGWLLFALVLLLPEHAARAAKQIEDVVVHPQPMYFGKTYHGYAETRIALENRSAKAHRVTLISRTGSRTRSLCCTELGPTQ